MLGQDLFEDGDSAGAELAWREGARAGDPGCATEIRRLERERRRAAIWFRAAIEGTSGEAIWPRDETTRCSQTEWRYRVLLHPRGSQFLLRRGERDVTALLRSFAQLEQAALADQRRLTVPLVKQVLGL